MTENVKKAIEKYKLEMQKLFGDTLIGIYLTGSIALGGFHEGKSDVDCSVLLKLEPNKNQIKNIKNIHSLISKEFKNIRLECQYFPIEYLGKSNSPLFYSYHDGNLKQGYFNHNAVTWYTLRYYGIVVCGTPVQTLDLQVSISDVKKYVKDNVNTYWYSWVTRLKKPFTPYWLASVFDSTIVWGVTGISRMYYTLKENDIASKDKAIEYAIKNIPDSANKLLKEVQYLRTGNGSRQYISPFRRRIDMIKYMEQVISHCQNI